MPTLLLAGRQSQIEDRVIVFLNSILTMNIDKKQPEANTPIAIISNHFRHHHLSLVAFIMLLAVTLSPGVAYGGNDTLATREVKVGRFDSVRLSGCVRVEYSQSSAYAVKVVASERGQEYIKVEQKDGRLHIYTKTPKRTLAGITYSTHENALASSKVYITSPKIAKLEADDVTEIRVAGDIKSEHLGMKLGGGASLNVAGVVSVRELDVSLSSVARARFKVLSAANARVSAAGATTFDVKDIAAERLLLDSRTGGKIGLKTVACKEVETRVEGVGCVTFGKLKAEKATMATQTGAEIIGEVEINGLLECHATGISKIRLTGKAGTLNETCTSMAEVSVTGNMVKTDDGVVDMCP